MKRSLKLVAVLAIISMVMMMGLPALAKGGKGKGKGQGHRGGKKAVGTVTAYEPASNLLTATMKDGSTFSGTVAEDVKVKLDHRGNNGPNKRKKPSNGDETDILPQAEILKMKIKCDEVTKLRLRAGTGVEPVEEPAEEAAEEPAVEPVEEPAAEEGTTETEPLVRMATEDGEVEEVEVEEPEAEESDGCAAEEAEEETDESSDLDDDLEGELDGSDGSDTSEGTDGTDDGTAGDGSTVEEVVECVDSLLEECA